MIPGAFTYKVRTVFVKLVRFEMLSISFRNTDQKRVPTVLGCASGTFAVYGDTNHQNKSSFEHETYIIIEPTLIQS